MSVLIQSSLMIILLISTMFFLLTKLINITKFNVSLLFILTGLWIVSGLLGISIIKEGGNWKWPILIGSSQLTQAVFRIPLGILSQKLKSRKIPIIIALVVMCLMSFSLLFTVSYSSLLIASIGLGFFGATYGLQNQYWSENWSIRNTFITTGLIMTISFLGKYVASVVDQSLTIDVDSLKWTMTGMLGLASIILFIYIIFHKEKTETILLDNKSSYASNVSEMTLKHIAIFSTMIIFSTIGVIAIKSSQLVKYSDNTLLTMTGWTVTVITGLLTAFILIRIIDDRIINFISHIIMAFGIILMIISLFAVNSITLSFIGLMFAIAGLSIYTTSMFGMMLHIDHKNTLLVLGIWLTVKSISIGMGQIIGGEVNIYAPINSKYLLIVSLVFVVISLIIIKLTYKYTKPGFDLIEELEYSNNHKKNFSEWK